MPDYRDLVEYVVRSLVDHPEAVDVSESGRGRSPRIEVRLHPEDVGRVIGKGGRNIEAVRSLVKAAAIRDHRRVSVEVVTEEDDARAAEAQAQPLEQVAAPLAADPVPSAAEAEPEA